MANRQIAGLTAASGPDRTFVQPIQDAAAAAEAKKITVANLLALALAADISDASANGRSLLTAANYAAMRTLLSLVPGTDVAAIASPTFTGTPAAPTAAAATNTTQLATTAFVTTADNLKADLASPALTGTPTAPTASAATSTTQVATTAFATTADNLKANIASPTLTGTPAAPTAATTTSTTQLATTAFVQQELTSAVNYAFKTLSVSGQSDVVADSNTDTLTLAAGSNVTITTNASTDTITIAASASGGSADDWEIVSTSNPGSPYTASTLTGNTVVKITALAGNLTINKPTGTFGASKRFTVRYEITASAADRTITWGTGISLGLGVAPSLVVTSGTTSAFDLYTDDDGSTFKYDGDFSIAGLTAKTTPVSGDYLLGMDSAASNALKKFQIPLQADTSTSGLAEAATIAETNTGTDAARYVSPDALAGAYAGSKSVSLPLAAAVGTDQATGDAAAWFAVPAALNGMNLVGVGAAVATAGTTGTSDYQLRRVRSGTPADMLSTKLTIASTATVGNTGTPYVIDTANDDVATNDLIYVDIDALSTTKPKGGAIWVEFRLP